MGISNAIACLFACIALNACSFPSRYYEYMPRNSGEIPAVIDSTVNFDSKHTSWPDFADLYLHISLTRINGKYGRTQQGTAELSRFKLNPGINRLSFHIHGSSKEAPISGDAELVLNAAAGMYYTIGAEDDLVEGPPGFITVWIKDASGFKRAAARLERQ